MNTEGFGLLSVLKDFQQKPMKFVDKHENRFEMITATSSTTFSTGFGACNKFSFAR